MTYFTFSCDFEIHYGICLIIQGTNNKPGFIFTIIYCREIWKLSKTWAFTANHQRTGMLNYKLYHIWLAFCLHVCDWNKWRKSFSIYHKSCNEGPTRFL